MVLGGAGQWSGERRLCGPNLHLLSSRSPPPTRHLPTALRRPGQGSGPWFPHLGVGEGRIKSRLLCLSQMTSPQLVTSTPCAHTCLSSGTSPAFSLHSSLLSPAHPHSGLPFLRQRPPSPGALSAGQGGEWALASDRAGPRSSSLPDTLVNLPF